MAALSKLPLRQLGRNGPFVPRLGLGLMSASGTYNAPLSEADHLAFMDEAYKRGETFWDTGRCIHTNKTNIMLMGSVQPINTARPRTF